MTVFLGHTTTESDADLESLAAGIPAGVTPASLRQYLTNGAVFNVKNFGAIGDGTTDDYAAIMLAFNDCMANGGGEIYFPPGVYFHSQNIVIYMPVSATNVVGVSVAFVGEGTSSILLPGPLVTRGLSVSMGVALVGNRIRIDSLIIDGRLTTGAWGFLAGQASDTLQSQQNITSYLVVYSLEVRNFLGTGAIGIYHSDVVGALYEDCNSVSNTTGLVVDAPGDPRLPTVTKFLACRFRQSTSRGVDFRQGYGTEFNFCVFESNGEEGFYCVPGAGKVVIGLVIRGRWFESNCLLGTRTTTSYFDGTGTTLQLRIEDVLFNDSVKSISLKHVVNLVLINNEFGIAVGSVELDSAVGGIILWNGNNSAISTVLINNSPQTTIVLAVGATSIDYLTTRNSIVSGVLSIGAASPSVFTLDGTHAATATNGTGEAMKANVEGYIIVNVDGVARKIPYVKS